MIATVSVMAPMWNEAEHIEALVDDIAAQDFGGGRRAAGRRRRLDRRLGRAPSGRRGRARHRADRV